MSSIIGRRSWLRISFFLSLAMVVLFSAGASARAGTIVADSGFRPSADGFSFRNYGGETGYLNLDATEVQRIFGRSVCFVGKGSKCVLTPAAQNWMEGWNEDMNGGHCYGMSTLALLIYSSKLPQFGIQAISGLGGGPTAFDLDIVNNERLQRSIARAFTFQGFPSVEEKSIKGTPNHILKFLIDHLSQPTKETWGLSIFQYGFKGGHEITPYAVEDMGEGKYEIHVYDNNHPNNDTRRVKVDTASNTWSYYATTKPGYPQAEYEGNAESKTLSLEPNGPALGIQPCPFCLGRRGAKSKYNQISLDGRADQHGRLLLTDSKGRQTGFRNGKIFNRIPGVQVLPQTSGGIQFRKGGRPGLTVDSPEPIYLVPKKLSLKVRVDGRHMKDQDTETLGVVGPTFDSSLENLKIGPGRVVTAMLSPKKQTLSLTTSKGKTSPKVTFGAESRAGDAIYRITSQADFAPSQSKLFYAKNEKRQELTIGSTPRRSQAWSIQIEKVNASGDGSEYGLEYRLRRGQSAFLRYGPLAAGKRASVVIVSKNGKKRILKLEKAPG